MGGEDWQSNQNEAHLREESRELKSITFGQSPLTMKEIIGSTYDK